MRALYHRIYCKCLHFILRRLYTSKNLLDYYITLLHINISLPLTTRRSTYIYQYIYAIQSATAGLLIAVHFRCQGNVGEVVVADGHLRFVRLAGKHLHVPSNFNPKPIIHTWSLYTGDDWLTLPTRNWTASSMLMSFLADVSNHPLNLCWRQ